MENIQNTSTQSAEYRELPVVQLVESPTNPRKRYQQASLEELAQSFRSHGVLEPLLVRPLQPDRFEIVADSRRYRAACIAELETVPARVQELTDREALEVQCIENLQREDIHPLEEAQGFRALLDLPDQQYTVARIAERAGKPPAYVLGRLKLTELIGEVADAFLRDKLTIGHALLIAKLPPAQQQEAFKAAFKSAWIGSAQTEILLPVRELASWIESNLLLDLQSAPFDRADASLVPEAGSCHDCMKRTGANSLLFPESQHDACLDGTCWKGKIAAHLATSVVRNPQLTQISSNWGSGGNGVLGRGQYVEIVGKAPRNGHGKLLPQQKKCFHVMPAIVVEGGNAGHVVDVCADPGCEVHHAESRRSREAQERVRRENRKQEEQRKQELATRIRVLGAPTAPPVALISGELRRRYFPAQDDPVGQRIHIGPPRFLHIPAGDNNTDATDVTVIGVVGDFKNNGLAVPPEPQITVLYSQHPLVNYGSKNIVVRAVSEPRSLTPVIRRQLHDLGPDLPLAQVQTIDEHVEQQTGGHRFTAALLASFAVAGLALATVGIYGVISYLVTQRTRELALRITLGASRARVLWLVVKQGVAMAAIGTAIGLSGAVAIQKLMGSLLFGISAVEPVTFAGGALFLVGVAAIASAIPGARVMWIDPASALRQD